MENIIQWISDTLGEISLSYVGKLNNDINRMALKTELKEFLSTLDLHDFLIICDESNNTPDRIDRNELWADISIQFEAGVNFTYIPIRVIPI